MKLFLPHQPGQSFQQRSHIFLVLTLCYKNQASLLQSQIHIKTLKMLEFWSFLCLRLVSLLDVDRHSNQNLFIDSSDILLTDKESQSHTLVLDQPPFSTAGEKTTQITSVKSFSNFNLLKTVWLPNNPSCNFLLHKTKITPDHIKETCSNETLHLWFFSQAHRLSMKVWKYHIKGSRGLLIRLSVYMVLSNLSLEKKQSE